MGHHVKSKVGDDSKYEIKVVSFIIKLYKRVKAYYKSLLHFNT